MWRRLRLGLATLLAVIALAVIAVAAPVAAAAQGEPERVVAALYDAVVAGHEPIWVNAARRGPPLSRGLVALWAKADAKARRDKDQLGAIDFDVITNSQGAELKSYALKTVSQDAARAVVAVTVVPDDWRRDSAAENELRYDLAGDGKAWAIDDVRGVAGKERWSLRAMLTRYLAQE